MDTATERPGAEPADEVVSPAGENPQSQGDTSATSELEAMDLDQIIDLLDGHQPQEPDTTPAAQPAETPAPETPQATDEEPAPQADRADQPPPDRLSLKGVSPEERILLAQAKNLVKEGKASSLFDAMRQLQPAQPESTPAAASTTPEAGESTTSEATTPQPESSLPTVAEIKDRIASLREERDQADDNFDRPEARRLTREIEDLQQEQLRAEMREERQQAEALQWDASFDKAAKEVVKHYPDADDPNTDFAQILDDKVAAAQARNDPRLKDPRYIIGFADEVARVLGQRQATTAGTTKAARTPAPVTPTGRDLAPGHATTTRLSQDEARARLQEMPLEALLDAVCTE